MLFINWQWKHYCLSCDRYLELSKRIRRMESGTDCISGIFLVSFAALNKVVCCLKPIRNRKCGLGHK